MDEKWRELRLGEVITLKRGYDLRTADRNQSGTVPVVSSSGITGSHDEAKVQPPGVVTGRYGTVGEVYYLTEPFWPLNTTLYVRDFKGNDPYFIYYFLHIINFERFSDKTGVPGVDRNDLHRIRVSIPPLPEQRRIAEILDTWDQAITLTERRIEAARQRKKDLMQRLLTGRMRFPEFEGEEWREVPLEDVAQVIMGQSPKSENYNEERSGLPLIQGNADIAGRKTAPKVYTSEVTKRCKPGDIILSVRAPVGDVALSVHNACIGRGVCAVCARKADPDFLYQMLVSIESQWDRYAQGSTFKAINSADIKRFRLKIPESREEQRRIAAVLQACDREIELLIQKRDALQRQKMGLMQRLLTGRVRVKL